MAEQIKPGADARRARINQIRVAQKIANGREEPGEAKEARKVVVEEQNKLQR